MRVFNILDQKCNIFGKKILEASAGTGKTFAIEHILVRLLIEKDSLITIDQILVVTFTKKATKELKFRIRNNLEKAVQFLNQKEFFVVFDYLIPYVNDKEAIYKLQNAIDLFETASIFTIHSFCFNSLKEFLLEADILIENEEESSNIALIKKLVFDYFKFCINSDEYSSEQIEILINFHRNIDNLFQKIINDIDKDFQKKEFKNFSDLYEKFLEKIKNFNKTSFDKTSFDFVYSEFDEIEKKFKKDQKFKNDNFIKQLELLVYFLNKKFSTKDEFRNLLKTKCSIFEFLSDNNKKVTQKNYVLPDFFLQMKETLYPIIKEAIDPKILYYRLIKDISLWVNDYLEKNEILNYDKILSKMKKAIETLSFKKKIQNKYKAVIIDEFQDTDSIQFDIFDKLFFSNEKMLAVYLIGDPKQSIYRFRKADLYTYLNAANKINEINYLDTNYRCSKSLINSLNELFNESFAKKWLKLPQLNKSLTYLPVKSGLNSDFDFQDKLAPIHFFIAEDSFKNQRWPTEEVEQKYFSYITNEIIKLKNISGFLDSNFAVLVNDRYQAQRLKHYFDKFSIQSVTTRGSTLKNSETVSALKEFLEAVFFPYDLNKIKIALKGPFIQMSDEILKNLNLEKDVIYLEKFYFLKSILNKGLSFFFNSFFYSSWLDKTILENIAALHDIKFYFETISLIELLISQKISSNQILNFLENLKDLDDEDEDLKVDQVTDLGVQILTTFMSKGLEYEIVFALSLANRNAKEFDENLEEIDAEKMRQFYVALTRAKYRVYLPIAIDANEKEIKDGTFSCMDYFFSHVLETKNFIDKQNLLNKLEELKNKNFISYSFVDLMNLPISNDAKHRVTLSSYVEFNKKFVSSFIYSFSSLHHEENLFLDEKKEAADFPYGPEIGILFHNIFEKILNKKSYDEKIIRKIIQENILDCELEQFEDKIFDVVKKTLEAPLLNESSFCLKDVPFENLSPEVEFLFSFKNDYIKGFIDLVFLYEDKYYIIDWKTNYLGLSSNDYNLENLHEHMKQHDYFLQAAIYLEALKRHLKILEKDFEKNFGGVFYIFLRGLVYGKRQGIYHFYPNLDLLNQINKKELNNIDYKYDKF